MFGIRNGAGDESSFGFWRGGLVDLYCFWAESWAIPDSVGTGNNTYPGRPTEVVQFPPSSTKPAMLWKGRTFLMLLAAELQQQQKGSSSAMLRQFCGPWPPWHPMRHCSCRCRRRPEEKMEAKKLRREESPKSCSPSPLPPPLPYLHPLETWQKGEATSNRSAVVRCGSIAVSLGSSPLCAFSCGLCQEICSRILGGQVRTLATWLPGRATMIHSYT